MSDQADGLRELVRTRSGMARQRSNLAWALILALGRFARRVARG